MSEIQSVFGSGFSLWGVDVSWIYEEKHLDLLVTPSVSFWKQTHQMHHRYRRRGSQVSQPWGRWCRWSTRSEGWCGCNGRRWEQEGVRAPESLDSGFLQRSVQVWTFFKILLIKSPPRHKLLKLWNISTTIWWVTVKLCAFICPKLWFVVEFPNLMLLLCFIWETNPFPPQHLSQSFSSSPVTNKLKDQEFLLKLNKLFKNLSGVFWKMQRIFLQFEAQVPSILKSLF